MDEIRRLRRRIDDIDQEIVHLLGVRFENAKLLGRAKKAGGLAVRDLERERTILGKVARLSQQAGLSTDLVGRIFQQIFGMSVRGQGEPPSSHKVLDGLRVTIVGGTGGMGTLFARFAADSGGLVGITGRQKSRVYRVAKGLGVTAASYSDAADSDVVIVAVPMEVTRSLCLRLARSMDKDSLLMDISSVKTGIADRIADASPSTIEYVSIHPLFGPSVDSFRSQTVVAIPFRTAENWQRFSRALRHSGARVCLSTFEAHDRTMAYVQGLHHAALISLGLALKNWDGAFTTDSMRMTMDRIRILVANWPTVAGIQEHNPYVEDVRKEFERVVSELVNRGFRAEQTLSELQSNVHKWSRKR